MKDNMSSLFLLKNTFGAKMKKGFRNFCNGDTSTSTLNHQQKLDHLGGGTSFSSTVLTRPLVNSPVRRESQPTTLEQMIFQLEMEEKMAARRRDDIEDSVGIPHRMSCVNSSDILRSARNALNQYPRFSLDGKDAMYRSSFTNLPLPNNIKSCDSIAGSRDYDVKAEKTRRLMPAMVAGESVIWCKPGVVAKLMGLDAMPIPLNNNNKRERLSCIIKRQNLMCKRVERQEIERKRRIHDDYDSNNIGFRSKNTVGIHVGACSRTGYCAMNPVVQLDFPDRDQVGWPMRKRFV